jgi:hypothetical protein
MNNENMTPDTPSVLLYKAPIPLAKAREQVDRFRKKLIEGSITATDLSFGVVHRRHDILHYVTEVFDGIVHRQETINHQPDINHEWAVAHFFMIDDWGKVVFCVAPVIVPKESEASAGQSAYTDPHEIQIWDPFSHGCPYPYTYSYILNPSGTTKQDDDVDIYDMGQMWP